MTEGFLPPRTGDKPVGVGSSTAESKTGMQDPGWNLAASAIFSPAELDEIRACKVLIIDDESANVRLLERVLTRAGFENFISTTDSREAAALFVDFEPDLVLTDWLMPDVDGFAVLEQLRSQMAEDDYLPIVVLTADITPRVRKRALSAGATDFLTKPFDQIEVLLRIQNLLKARLSHLFIQTQKTALEDSVRLRTIELEQALTELKRTQQQVIQQERLAALGSMAGGIAHDFNNALSIIMGFGELLLRDAEHGLTKERAAPSITTILTAAEDAAKIVDRLREFYRPDAISDQRIPVDLNRLVEQAISLTQPRWQTEATAAGRSIAITTELGDIPPVIGAAAELREVLTNLIFNAVDALPQGGTITLATAVEGESILLKVADTGVGMSEEVRQRCLEPFFTTKGKVGTGLGLSMVFGIVQRHHGSVEIQSEPGKGTTFALHLPAASVDSDPALETISSASGTLRVLVVDDHPILCQLVCEYLHDDLHNFETAPSGSAALKKFRAGRFDLVITDQVMAEMTGEQLAIAIKEVDPKVPIILLTGYVGESTAGNKFSPAIDLVLGKPLSRNALRQAFVTVLGGI